jgi:hypothetical protein
MPYFCYLYPNGGGVPYFEVLAGPGLDSARRQADEVIRQRPEYELAELWEGDRLVEAVAVDAVRIRAVS